MSTTSTAPARKTPASKARCEVVDQIIEWTDKDGNLQIHAGDLVLHRGRFEALATVGRTGAGQVRYALEHWPSVEFAAPDHMVAVRRYVETTEE
jgi:hypothetical protein